MRGLKRLAKEHICIYAKPMDTDNSAVKTGVRVGAGWRGAKGGGMQNICNSVNNKKNSPDIYF